MNSFAKILLLAIIIAGAGVSAATLKGTVFDSALEPAKGIVTVNTTPEQKFVAQNGSFEFQVSRGFFEITASAGNHSVTETVAIVSDGVFNIDLVILGFDAPKLDIPTVSEETGLDAVDNARQEQAPTQPSTFDWTALVLPLFILVFIAIAFFFHREFRNTLSEVKKLQKSVVKKRLPKTTSAFQPTYIPPSGLSELQQEIMRELKKSEGRMNQKQLRELLPFSEAKVSIELDALEEKGLIKKFKKGRGNVIVLVGK